MFLRVAEESASQWKILRKKVKIELVYKVAEEVNKKPLEKQ